MSLRNKATQVTISDIGTNLVGAIAFIYFSRVLGPRLFGSYVLFLALANLGNFVAGFGVGGAVRKRISEGEQDIFITGLVIKVPFFLLIALAILLLRGKINSYVGISIGIYLIPIILVKQLGTHLIVTIEGQQDVNIAALGRLAQRIILATGGIGLIYLDFGVYGLIVALFASWTLTGLILFSQVSIAPGQPTLQAAISLIDYAKHNFISSIGTQAYSWTDTLVIGYFLGQSFVGIYEIAWRISSVSTMVSTSIGRTIFPKISELHTNKDIKTIENILPDAITGAITFIVPAMVGAIILGRELLKIVFGIEYISAAIPLVILIGGRIFEGANDIISQTVFGVDRPEAVAKAVALFIGLNIFMNLIFIPIFGLVGAALSTSISFIIMVLQLVYFLNKVIQVNINVQMLIYIVGSSLTMGLIVSVVKFFVRPNTLPRLTILIFIGVSSYLAILVVSESFRRRIPIID